MKKSFLFSLVPLGFLFADNFQEVALDKLKNKKVYSMTLEEFENLKKQEDYRKERLIQKKENLQSSVKEVVLANDEPIMETEVKKTALEVKKPLETKSSASNNLTEKKDTASTLKVETQKTEQPVAEKQLSMIEKLSSLQLENGISFFLEKSKDLSVFEFEQGKSFLYEKILSDNRFDKDMLISSNILALNKSEFINFLNEIKNSIIIN